MTQQDETERLPSEDRQNDWLSLGRAARLLGVSEVTLRHWADEGRVRSYRTMGAHRRFARVDLRNLVADRQGRIPKRENLGDRTLERLRRRFRNPRTAERLPGEPMEDEGRVRLRVLGRRVVDDS